MEIHGKRKNERKEMGLNYEKRKILTKALLGKSGIVDVKVFFGNEGRKKWKMRRIGQNNLIKAGKKYGNMK